MIAQYELYIILSFIIFAIGAAGALTRRNVIVIFMCIEIMLNAVNLALVTFSRMNQSLDGAYMVLFIMAVAAAEAAVGLAIFILLFRKHGTLDVEKFSLMKW